MEIIELADRYDKKKVTPLDDVTKRMKL